MARSPPPPPPAPPHHGAARGAGASPGDHVQGEPRAFRGGDRPPSLRRAARTAPVVVADAVRQGPLMRGERTEAISGISAVGRSWLAPGMLRTGVVVACVLAVGSHSAWASRWAAWRPPRASLERRLRAARERRPGARERRARAHGWPTSRARRKAAPTRGAHVADAPALPVIPPRERPAPPSR